MPCLKQGKLNQQLELKSKVKMQLPYPDFVKFFNKELSILETDDINCI